MLTHRKTARAFLLSTDKPTFLEVVYRAKVTPRQKEILYAHFLDDKSYVQISLELNICVETVKTDIERAYDLIYRYLFCTQSSHFATPLLV